jgi:hypothetical protein
VTCGLRKWKEMRFMLYGFDKSWFIYTALEVSNVWLNGLVFCLFFWREWFDGTKWFGLAFIMILKMDRVVSSKFFTTHSPTFKFFYNPLTNLQSFLFTKIPYTESLSKVKKNRSRSNIGGETPYESWHYITFGFHLIIMD